MIYRRGQSMRVMVYAGLDPLTGKKKRVSRQVRGTGRAALKEAKQIEAKLLAEVAGGRHPSATDHHADARVGQPRAGGAGKRGLGRPARGRASAASGYQPEAARPG